MDTANPPAPGVIEDVPVWNLRRGDKILIEQHVVRSICTGTREVLAEVTTFGFTIDGLLFVEWAGAATGADNSTGTTTYDRDASVTRLPAVTQVAA